MAENKASTQMIQLEKTSIPKKNMTVAAFVAYFVVVTTSGGTLARSRAFPKGDMGRTNR